MERVYRRGLGEFGTVLQDTLACLALGSLSSDFFSEFAIYSSKSFTGYRCSGIVIDQGACLKFARRV